jgi:hypothetical protein
MIEVADPAAVIVVQGVQHGQPARLEDHPVGQRGEPLLMPERYRLSIGFTDRQALLDFVELLKREQLVPRDARVERVESLQMVEPAAEEYVVTMERAA